MEKATKILVEEHKNILKIADAIEKECDSLEKGKKVDDEFFKSVIDFIRNYADKFHHAKEEDILFKEFSLMAEKGEVHCNPVEQMLFEHDEGRKFIKGIEQGMSEINRKKVIGNARNYIRLIREHIFKEDEILYPMAEKILGKKQYVKMLKKFKEIENKKKQKNKKYMELVKR